MKTGFALETELIDRHSWRTRADARLAVFDFIEAVVQPSPASPLPRSAVAVRIESSQWPGWRSSWLDSFGTSSGIWDTIEASRPMELAPHGVGVWRSSPAWVASLVRRGDGPVLVSSLAGEVWAVGVAATGLAVAVGAARGDAAVPCRWLPWAAERLDSWQCGPNRIRRVGAPKPSSLMQSELTLLGVVTLYPHSYPQAGRNSP